MTIQLHAQPYDLAATGFYFEDYDDYIAKAAALRNSYGAPVEEFEIQFIDGDAIDCDLAQAIGINQANLKQFFEALDDWDDDDKTCVIIAVGECVYPFEDNTQPDDFEVDIYHLETMRDLAEESVEQGLYGDIPAPLAYYIDYDAIARDLSMDYSQTSVAGQSLIYRCA